MAKNIIKNWIKHIMSKKGAMRIIGGIYRPVAK